MRYELLVNVPVAIFFGTMDCPKKSLLRQFSRYQMKTLHRVHINHFYGGVIFLGKKWLKSKGM